MPSIDLQQAFGMAPKDAVAYFKAKGFDISWNWQDTWEEAHARAFTVAKGMKMDVLTTIRESVAGALSEGITEKQFADELTPRLQTLGWWGRKKINREGDEDENGEEVQLGSPRRLKTIYRTNMHTAYMAGRYKQQLESSDTHPWWMYAAIADGQTRKTHEAMSGKVFAFDDPLWDTHYPPNDWGCRCRVRALSEKRVKALGIKVQSSKGRISRSTVDAGTDKETGEVYRADISHFDAGRQTVTTSPGWNYSVGQAAYGTDVAILRKLSSVNDMTVRTQAVQALNNSPARQAVFSNWIEAAVEKVLAYQLLLKQIKSGEAGKDKLRGAGVNKKSKQTLAFMDEDVYEYVRKHGDQSRIPARILIMSETEVAHAHSEKHQKLAITLTIAEYQSIAKKMADGDADIAWEKGQLIYLFETDDPEYLIKVIVNPYSNKVGKMDAVINAFRVPEQSRHSFKTLIKKRD